MTRLAQLPTLAELQAQPRARTKRQLGTKLDRAIAKKAARLADLYALRRWAFAVKTRDQWRDRKTGAAVQRSRDLDPWRAEAHHLVSRDDRSVRYDIRNGVCLSFATHYAIERGDYRIEGTRWFSVNGQRYIDATFPVYFVRT